MWLPCGGHVEPGETPDEAAVREVFEESGVRVELIGNPALSLDEPRQLTRPRGVQIEVIGFEHEHIDFVYFAAPVEPYEGRVISEEPTLAWYGPDELARLPLNQELRAWTRLVLSELGPCAVAER